MHDQHVSIALDRRRRQKAMNASCRRERAPAPRRDPRLPRTRTMTRPTLPVTSGSATHRNVSPSEQRRRQTCGQSASLRPGVPRALRPRRPAAPGRHPRRPGRRRGSGRPASHACSSAFTASARRCPSAVSETTMRRRSSRSGERAAASRPLRAGRASASSRRWCARAPRRCRSDGRGRRVSAGRRRAPGSRRNAMPCATAIRSSSASTSRVSRASGLSRPRSGGNASASRSPAASAAGARRHCVIPNRSRPYALIALPRRNCQHSWASIPAPAQSR